MPGMKIAVCANTPRCPICSWRFVKYDDIRGICKQHGFVERRVDTRLRVEGGATGEKVA